MVSTLKHWALTLILTTQVWIQLTTHNKKWLKPINVKLKTHCLNTHSWSFQACYFKGNKIIWYITEVDLNSASISKHFFYCESVSCQNKTTIKLHMLSCFGMFLILSSFSPLTVWFDLFGPLALHGTACLGELTSQDFTHILSLSVLQHLLWGQLPLAQPNLIVLFVFVCVVCVFYPSPIPSPLFV